MDSGYVLDTCAISAYLNPLHPHHATAVAVIDALPAEALKVVAAPTLGELEYGTRLAEQAGSSHLSEMRDRLRVVRGFTVLSISQHTADEYGILKAKLAAQVLRKRNDKLPRWVEDWVDHASGQKLQIDENDLWIAAIAKERDLTIVSGDGDTRKLQAVDSDLRVLLTTP